MPGGMNGNELVDEVLRLKLGVKVLLTSGYSENFRDRNDGSNDVVRLLPRPYSMGQLKEAIRAALEHVGWPTSRRD